ncbi:hypothetical protein SanaruYs_04440 [Chryseotalea sanaruensis]|uniref:Uncharacterized protein n=1 Tax=Chryseotalea sanaruensis TaxID=2482724 RepID=A0A401U5T0_9BACT|nr:hypothetical protein [Chryseotalea sanaruensis]GCC50229.1 hypothetical protein SanaruYs_04440 [Chryseotalea sanaruensis]
MKTFLVIVTTFVSWTNLYSQSFYDYAKQRDTGIGLNYNQYKGFAIPDPISNPTYNELDAKSSYGLIGYSGWNFPILILADHTSIGFNPNIGVGISLTGGYGVHADIPIFITLKTGTDATWSKSTTFEKKVGAAIGIGYQTIAGYTEAPIASGIGVIYALPSAMAEVSFVIKKTNLYKLRFQTNLKETKQKDFSESTGFPAEVSFTQWGISIIKTRYAW